MTKYPNDPGPDRQDQNGLHRPHEEMTLITTEVFLEGISLQTKYAYKCAHDFFHQAINHADGVGTSLSARITAAELDITSKLNDHLDAMTMISERVKENERSICGLMDSVTRMSAKFNDRMTGRDHCHLLEQIYSM